MHSIDKIHAITVNQNLPFVLYLPDDYDTSGDKQYPFILFLHGAGERGNDINRVKLVGLPKNLERGDNLPFIILVPQCPEDHWWADNRHALITLVDWALANYRVDAARVYLTGLSMGGRGTWDMATLYPHRFAAVAPICGWGDGLFGYPDRVKRITHLPVWTFHGDADEVVPVKATELLVEKLKEYGGDVQMTIYPGVGHDSWTETYDNPELYEWFLKHKL
jgi:predicted peptidase